MSVGCTGLAVAGSMFALVKMKDAIPIPADKLDKPRSIAVSHQIEEKYCNRVLLDTGLCICLYELLEVPRISRRPLRQRKLPLAPV